MTPATPPDAPKTAKLPKWAQARIGHLEMRLAEANERRDSEAKTNVVVDAFSRHPLYLPDDARVRWLMPDDDWVEVNISKSVDGQVSVRIHGRDSIRVLPVSSNVIEVAVLDRWSKRVQK